MTAPREAYARKALTQIPRLLSLQDRNPYSPTYGCFHRDYWLFKTSDFPDAVRQFGVHALALAYVHDIPGNRYQGQRKIRDWAIAGLDYWASIQHKEGSFDEFYPYERGWVGPTAFTTYTSIEAYHLLKEDIPPASSTRILGAIERAAQFIAAGESEEDHLANHHAMAALTLWKAHRLLDDPGLRTAYERAFEVFLTYHNHAEGWSREYDGVDPGYLSATVSFLGKVYQENRDTALREVLEQAVSFASYFVYPNGFYAGSMGSRNTLHFYPHGFEILAEEMPLAASIAEKMLHGLAEDKLVPPEIMADRYVFYRVPELLLSYLDYTPRPDDPPPLPFERAPFTDYYPESRIFVSQRPAGYTVANLAKGGVVKAFDAASHELQINDCGIIGELADGQIVTSQWIDPSFSVETDDDGWRVSGQLHAVPSNKLFTPFRLILFRGALVALGWIPAFAHWLKGQIRKALILGQRTVPVTFTREMQLTDESLTLTDTVQAQGSVQFARVSIGDEFFVRYVPQSRYFQSQELGLTRYDFTAGELARLNAGEIVSITRSVP